jgi:hypothetical protein
MCKCIPAIIQICNSSHPIPWTLSCASAGYSLYQSIPSGSVTVTALCHPSGFQWNCQASDCQAPTVKPPTVKPPTVKPPTVKPPTVKPPTVKPPTCGLFLNTDVFKRSLDNPDTITSFPSLFHFSSVYICYSCLPTKMQARAIQASEQGPVPLLWGLRRNHEFCVLMLPLYPKYLEFRTVSDPLVSVGRHFGRTQHVFINIHLLMVNGMAVAAEESQVPMSFMSVRVSMSSQRNLTGS